MTDLTPERLREWLYKDGDVTRFFRLCDAWERDRQRLEAERDTLQQNWQRCVEHAARAEEERDRLREALEKMEAMPDTAMPKARRIAHEALAATTDSQVNPEKRDD